MIRKAVAVISVCLAAPPAAASAQDSYHVRNDTGRSLTCGLRRHRVVDRFVLVRGTEMTRTAIGGNRRTLLCDSAIVTQRFRIWPGIRYALVSIEGEVMLQPLGRAPPPGP
jgi:hypothetical protein